EDDERDANVEERPRPVERTFQEYRDHRARHGYPADHERLETSIPGGNRRADLDHRVAEAFAMRPVTPSEEVPPAPIFKEPAEKVPFVAEDDVHRELIDEVKEPNGADREDYGQSKRAQERTVCHEPSKHTRRSSAPEQSSGQLSGAGVFTAGDRERHLRSRFLRSLRLLVQGGGASADRTNSAHRDIPRLPPAGSCATRFSKLGGSRMNTTGGATGCVRHAKRRWRAVLPGVVLALTVTGVRSAQTMRVDSPLQWVPFLHLPGVVDLSGARRDGSLTVTAGGHLFLLQPSGAVLTFARGPSGYATSP